ncbi:MAG: phospholipid carrier-dependent glycosyltransferase, partial [Chloroflexi bacterium]|nr:phospholipid carrier-dependent glycosyltransferase [Chloroflexota bacterium]
NLAAISHLNPDWFDLDVNADHRSVANQYIHTAAETFPYQGAVWAVHAARLFSTLLGCLTVLLVYAIARLLVAASHGGGNSDLLPLLAAALVALNPKFIHVSSIVSNDIAITLAATLACWWMVRMATGDWKLEIGDKRLEIGDKRLEIGDKRLEIGDKRLEIRDSRLSLTSNLQSLFRNLQSPISNLLLGALIGIAVLCKVTGLGLLLPAGVLIAFSALRLQSHARLRGVLLAGLMLAAGLALTAGPWFAYNAVQYGNPLAWAQVQVANQALLRQPPLNVQQIIGAIPEVLVSYWGVIGIELRFPAWVNWVFGAGLGLAILGIIKMAITAWRRNPVDGTVHRPVVIALALLVTWEAVLLASYAVWLRDYVGTENSRLILPGVALVAIAVAAGWLALIPARARPVVIALVCAGMALLSAGTPFLIVQPAFATPVYLTDAQRAALPGQTGVTFGGKIRLQHAQIDSRSVKPGEPLDVSLYWGALQPLRQSYHVILSARDPQGQLIGRLEAIPFNGRFDTQRWATGRIFRDDYRLPIDAAAQRGIATVQVSVRGIYEKPPLLPVDGAGSDRFTIGRFKVLGPIQAVAAPQHVFDAYFADAGARLIQLQGFDTSVGDGSLSLALHWQCLQLPNQDYTLFVHVLDSNGTIISQQDAQPLDGAYPTSMWDAKEQVIDRRTIAIPGSAASLRIGWYAAGSGARLQAQKPDGSRWADDSVIIPLPHNAEP